MADAADLLSLHDDLPFSWDSLRALLGAEFHRARLTSVSPLALRSRNRLYRVNLEDAPYGSLVLKLVRQEGDRFWEHHLRREHWVLELLERHWPNGAPRPLAAAFGQRWGVLVMQDVGQVSLAETLGDRSASRLAFPPAPSGTPLPLDEIEKKNGHRLESAGAWQTPQLLAVLERLAELHALLRAQHGIFYRVCRSVELDRITAASLLARVRVARARLHAANPAHAARVHLPGTVRQAYTERVIRPLMSGRRQMIHNSLSPLNVVLGPAPCFVDWETMAYAAPEFDVADLLRYPAVDLLWPSISQIVEVVFGPRIDPARLRLASLARALDYAGSNTHQIARSLDTGDAAHAQAAGARRDWYLREARTLAEALGLSSLVEAIIF